MAFSSQSGSSSGYSTGSSVSGPVALPGAQQNYNQLLNLSLQNYKATQDAYTGALRNAQAQQGSINQGYGQLAGNVANTLGLGGKGWGVATPAAQSIQRTFEQTQAQNQQNLISAGLGNSTVLANLQSGAALQAGQAYGGLGAQLAQTYAGYQSQFGLAQLANRQQGLGLQTGIQSQLGNALAGYQFRNNFGNLYGEASQSNNQSRNASSNFGSSYSPSGGGGGGYGGGSNAGQQDPSQLPANYYQGGPNVLGGYGSNYFGGGQAYGGQYAPVGGGSVLNLGNYDEAGTGVVPGEE